MPVRRAACAGLAVAIVLVLLALSAHERSGLTLQTLAPLVSVSRAALREWLDWLEDRQLVASGWNDFTDQPGAVITRAGSELVHNYLLATSSLQRHGRH